jgi:hypothetical protein
MKELIEDYKRKLATVNKMIEGLEFQDINTDMVVRYRTKASCYKTFISELERIKN